MSDEQVDYSITEAGALALRITELEYVLRHFDRTSMDLHHYVRSVDGLPDAAQWTMVVEQVRDMVDAYGGRNSHR
jgi:hypothetical protein